MYRFNYLFVILSLMLLQLPFTADWFFLLH